MSNELVFIKEEYTDNQNEISKAEETLAELKLKNKEINEVLSLHVTCDETLKKIEMYLGILNVLRNSKEVASKTEIEKYESYLKSSLNKLAELKEAYGRYSSDSHMIMSTLEKIDAIMEESNVYFQSFTENEPQRKYFATETINEDKQTDYLENKDINVDHLPEVEEKENSKRFDFTVLNKADNYDKTPNVLFNDNSENTDDMSEDIFADSTNIFNVPEVQQNTDEQELNEDMQDSSVVSDPLEELKQLNENKTTESHNDGRIRVIASEDAILNNEFADEEEQTLTLARPA